MLCWPVEEVQSVDKPPWGGKSFAQLQSNGDGTRPLGGSAAIAENNFSGCGTKSSTVLDSWDLPVTCQGVSHHATPLRWFSLSV